MADQMGQEVVRLGLVVGRHVGDRKGQVQLTTVLDRHDVGLGSAIRFLGEGQIIQTQSAQLKIEYARIVLINI